MNYIKVSLLVLAYLLVLIIAVPCVILLIISGTVIYSTLKIEKMAVKVVDNNELNRAWCKLCDLLADLIYNLRNVFLDGIGL